jgi:hypothetical protein
VIIDEKPIVFKSIHLRIKYLLKGKFSDTLTQDGNMFNEIVINSDEQEPITVFTKFFLTPKCSVLFEDSLPVSSCSPENGITYFGSDTEVDKEIKDLSNEFNISKISHIEFNMLEKLDDKMQRKIFHKYMGGKHYYLVETWEQNKNNANKIDISRKWLKFDNYCESLIDYLKVGEKVDHIVIYEDFKNKRIKGKLTFNSSKRTVTSELVVDGSVKIKVYSISNIAIHEGEQGISKLTLHYLEIGTDTEHIDTESFYFNNSRESVIHNYKNNYKNPYKGYVFTEKDLGGFGILSFTDYGKVRHNIGNEMIEDGYSITSFNKDKNNNPVENSKLFKFTFSFIPDRNIKIINTKTIYILSDDINKFINEWNANLTCYDGTTIAYMSNDYYRFFVEKKYGTFSFKIDEQGNKTYGGEPIHLYLKMIISQKTKEKEIDINVKTESSNKESNASGAKESAYAINAKRPVTTATVKEIQAKEVENVKPITKKFEKQVWTFMDRANEYQFYEPNKYCSTLINQLKLMLAEPNCPVEGQINVISQKNEPADLTLPDYLRIKLLKKKINKPCKNEELGVIDNKEVDSYVLEISYIHHKSNLDNMIIILNEKQENITMILIEKGFFYADVLVIKYQLDGGGMETLYFTTRAFKHCSKSYQPFEGFKIEPGVEIDGEILTINKSLAIGQSQVKKAVGGLASMGGQQINEKKLRLKKKFK